QIIEAAESEELRRRMMSVVWSTRSLWAAVLNDPDRAAECSQKATEFLLPEDITQRAVVFQTRVRAASIHGDTNEIRKALSAALPVYREAEHLIFQVWGQMALALTNIMQARLSEGEEDLKRVQQFSREHLKTRPETLLYTYAFLCDVNRERNDLENAKSCLTDALTLIRQTGRECFPGYTTENVKALALMLELCDDRAQADALIEQALQRVRRWRNEVLEKQLTALNVLLVFRRGSDVAFVKRWAETSGFSANDE